MGGVGRILTSISLSVSKRGVLMVGMNITSSDMEWKGRKLVFIRRVGGMEVKITGVHVCEKARER